MHKQNYSFTVWDTYIDKNLSDCVGWGRNRESRLRGLAEAQKANKQWVFLWRWKQSGANFSPGPNSLLTGKNTGNLRGLLGTSRR
jgi:hypothetical protein